MNGWSVEPLKGPAIYIVPLVGIISLLFGLLLSMVHVFKVPPEKMWVYRKSAWARQFIDSEIEHVANNKEYKIRGAAGAIMFLFIGTVVSIIAISNLINYISGSGQNPPH